MVDRHIQEVYRALREGQNKYTYFLLAATGAALGFAISQTQGDALAWSQLPLGAAVVAWGVSFYMGCRHSAYVNSSLYANVALLKVQRGENPEVGTHPQLMEAASAGIKDAIEKNSNKANWLGHWQFRLLITGAVLYVVWHIVEMWLLIGPAPETS